MAVSESFKARRASLWADVAVLGVALVWGASYPVAKGALAHMPVLLLIFYRFALTALVMTSVAYRDLRRAPRRELSAGALLGAILCAIFIAETRGVAMTTATNTALIISLCTIFTPFLEFGLQRKLPPVGVMAGAVVAVIGVMVLSGGMGALGAGDMLVLCAAGLRAVMVVSTKRLMEGSRLSSAALTAVQAAMVAGLTGALLLGQSGFAGLLVRADVAAWGAVAFLSLFCTVGAFYVQNAAVRRTSPTRVSFLMGTEPLFGFALAWALLSEPVTPTALLGATLIVSGTFVGLWVEREH
ncbi:DMT family transporter [Phaeobacter sp. PT47_59]|uniref:DMT family transporter n=1 Tax=Phaeobacter sp. PT47_59 TaxID=3029979 RepID=UPI0023807341|nr:DMT family transporter [Phaeobacter sp. PT47_59]MDE4176708.1 DMT family transporter [Phaeobacter sp. PT47_59]